jgi:phospholipase C
MSNLVQHVFVLMLENRAFDHMLGFSKAGLPFA